ncbi:hypothetical protein B0H13DRAFT_1854959 [Mycena leptocephala]|nr:hypothetical protein B0H13DRAFT_1854959 [Mycena leptocephala]
MLGDSRHNSKKNCLLSFAPAALVVKSEAQKVFILWEGSALDGHVIPQNVTSYGDQFSWVLMPGDSQRNSKQNCLLGFAPASLVVKPEAQKFFILWGGGALDGHAYYAIPQNVTSYGDRFSWVLMLGNSQHDSKENCFLSFAPAALVVKPEAQKLFILWGGGALDQ